MISNRRRTAAVTAGLLIATGALLTSVGANAASEDPSAEQTAAMVAERQRFFGAENVDPVTGALPRDEVHLVWVSVATFAAALDGHVVLFDAYIHKEEDERAYVPATTDDLIALRPEAILLGHAHYDHGLLAGPIAAATGATVVGTRGHCDQSTADAGVPLECVVAFEPDAAFGDVSTVELVPGICSTSVLHVHSAAEPPDPETFDPTNPAVGIPDPGAILAHPPGPSTTLIAPGDEHGIVLYQLRIGHFSLTMHDSSGPLKEQAPEVFDVLRALPPTDVQSGALVSFNNPTNGLRDPAMYIDAIDPDVFIPNHHDFVSGEYGGADDFEPALARELEDYDADPELRFLGDPIDYVRPNLLAFNVTDPRWVDAGEEPCVRAAGAAPVAGAAGSDAAGSVAGGSATGGPALQSKGALPATGPQFAAGAAALVLLGSLLMLRRTRRA